MEDRVAAGLAETVRALRAELTAAMQTSADEPLRFQLGPVELEVILAITREGGVDGGVRFGVVSFGAKGGLKDEATHRLSLSLQPVLRDSEGRTKPAEIRGKTHGEPGVGSPETRGVNRNRVATITSHWSSWQVSWRASVAAAEAKGI